MSIAASGAAVDRIKSYERLADLDLAVISADELARCVEAETISLFGLRRAALNLGPGPTAISRTPDGLVIPLPEGHIVGVGDLREGWETEGRLFAAQVGSLMRAQRALVLNRRHEAEISALYATVGQLTARLDVGAVLRTVVERARELLQSDIAYIMLLDEGGRTLRMRLSVGHQHDAFMNIQRPVRPGVSAYIGKAVSTPDFLHDTGLDHDGATDDLVRLEGVRSVLGVPLRTELAALGTLIVANRVVKQFTETEIALLSGLGEHAALAIDNARLYEEAVASAEASSVARSEAEGHLRRLQRAEAVHHRLTEVLLAGEGVAGVARTLAESFAARLVITDWRHRVLAEVGAHPVVDKSGEIAASLLRRRDVRAALERCASEFETVAIGAELVVAPIAARRELLGYIWALRSGDGPLDEVMPTSIEQAARVIALEMLREREAIETERRLRRDFMYELLSDHPPEAALLEQRARQVWQAFGLHHRALVISVVSRNAVGGSPVERARRLVVDDRPADFATVHGRHLVLLTTLLERDEVMAEAKAVRDLLALNGMETEVAVGGICQGLVQTRETVLSASRLLDLLSPQKVLWTEGLEPLTLLFEPSQRARLDVFVGRALAPLEGKPALMATLHAYYESAGNRAEAARKLKIHVNTLRQRLERVEEMVGGSVDESARALPLRLALLARGLSS
jgi:PucR C-terminal helix-turn-helix domain/GAF domain